MKERIDEILEFWFADSFREDLPTGRELWFEKSVGVDRAVEKRFTALVRKAREGELDSWASTARGRLALILLLDQFPRNIHRENPNAFTSDEKALSLCFDGLDEGMDKELDFPQRAFFCQPAMHTEDVDAQLASVEIYQELLAEAPEAHQKLCEEFLRKAERNRDIVERFERFPHRNGILDRQSTPEESAFLQQSGQL